jgi:aspartate/methionine/tyrosine aminotransferase
VEEIARIAVSRDLFVISDEVYEKLIYDGREHVSFASLPGMKERTLTVMSYSKTFCICGWRIGYAAGPAFLVNNMVKFQQFNSVHPPAPMQKAVLFYMNRAGEFMECIRKIYLARRDYMVDLLNQIKEIHCPRPSGAFYLFVNIKSLGCTSDEFARFLLQDYRIISIPGSAFGPSGEGYIRLCLTVPIEKLQVACLRIEKAIPQLKSASSSIHP